ncbi:glycosyltransferase [Pedobacter jamesrossensis]|uniref:Glycosyltransferase n=1 Tax=Pedobacter jamesrossensis TaxID=1908238 RepID=A0ABV8NJI3_9SPHI
MNQQDDKKLLKVLVITYDYFPDSSPNTYRWHNVLKSWKSLGHEVFVVSAQKTDFSNEEVVDGIKVFRTGKSWLEILKSKMPKTVKLEGQSDTANRSLTKESMVKRIYNSTFKQIYFPDFAFLWRRPAIALAERLIIENKIDNVITVSWPFTDHLIGYQLKKKHKINWIADTIDPFYLSDAVNNSFFYKKANRRLENKILSKASYITVLTEKLKQKYVELYPALKNKVIVNHNIFVPYDISINIKEKDDKIKLVFFGTLTPKSRSPLTLLKLMAQIDKLKLGSRIELHIYGDTNQCNHEFEYFKFLINKNVFVHGTITKDQVKKYGECADILVNIGNTNEYQEPSKLIEYIYLQKPVLNICSISDDSSKEILRHYPLNFNFYKGDLDNDDKLNQVIEFIENDNSKPFERREVMQILKKYLVEYVQAVYFKLLE